MEMAKLPDLICEGVSSAAGGTYDQVKIEGVGTATGSVIANTFKGNGNIRVKGDLAAGELECNGMVNVNGDLRFGNMKADGMLGIGGAARGEVCVLNGLLRVKGDCELENFTGVGGFVIGGLLSAGHVDIKLHGAGIAKEIGVESLVVRQIPQGRWNRMLGSIFPKLKPELSAAVIEGDTLDLEYTKAEVVRGNAVIVGKGCTIGRVEYRSELTVHRDAVIGQEEKTGE
ncbi:hypothetical protein [Paenibacillus sp. sgz500958]|uniref:hypothetical protein n=1 Tax=Paenibacillus sp. sgz500958 TaxID=3242475 RepID=UPI0036D22614